MEFIEQIFRFSLVGVMATITDFLGYNLILRYLKDGRKSRVVASVISVTLAMSVSFSWNRLWVFGDLNAKEWPVAEFLAVTFVSAYGIQSLVIYLLSRKRRIPVRLTDKLSDLLGANRETVADVVDRNAVKIAAVGLGLIWNFSWYRWFVFA